MVHLPIDVPEEAYVTIMQIDDPNLPKPNDGDVFELVEREFYLKSEGAKEIPIFIRIPNQNAIHYENCGGFLFYLYYLQSR